MKKIVINIGAHTFPCAANISEVTPIQVAVSVKASTLPAIILDITTIAIDTNQSAHSLLVILLNGLFIFLIPFIR